MAAKQDGRPRSAIRGYTSQGNDFGVSITAQDTGHLEQLGRWYALSVDHLVRNELGPEHWHPENTTDPAAGVTDHYRRRAYAIRRRLSRLSRITENAGNHTGPLVGSMLSYDATAAWFATRYGASAARLPWMLRPSINPMYAQHAWMAADAGMQLERLGHRVLSERELTTGVDQFGDEVVATLLSHYTTKTGSTAAKKPDLAVLAPNGRDYIAIEAERDENRHMRAYTEKLSAYRANSSIRAVWYLCRSMTTAHRVGTAASRVLPQDFPLRITVMQDCTGRLEVPDLHSNPKFMGDLRDIDTHHSGGQA